MKGKGIKLKILLIVFMLVPVAKYSCTDKCNEDNDKLYRQPYFSMQDLVFVHVDEYTHNNKTEKLMFKSISQNYDSVVYTAINMAMFFQAPDTSLLFHDAINNSRKTFGFFPEAIACNRLQNGYAGTKDLVDKIYISSEFDFDETHPKGYDMGDIVKIFAYTTKGENSWDDLDNYNRNSPYEAPKRFYLLLKRNPTLSKTHRFTVSYYMKTEEGQKPKSFIMRTPFFTVK